MDKKTENKLLTSQTTRSIFFGAELRIFFLEQHFCSVLNSIRPVLVTVGHVTWARAPVLYSYAKCQQTVF